MPVVWKLDRELQLRGWIPESVARLITGRCLRMTNRADRRPRAFEKLRAVTVHTRIVIRVILDVGKNHLVTRIARRLMFCR